MFESHLNYSLVVWAQNSGSIKRLLTLQKKSQRIMHFIRNAHALNLFKILNVLKIPDKVILENCVLVNLYQKLPKTGSFLQQLHIYIIADGLTQVALKYLFLIQNYMEDTQSI